MSSATTGERYILYLPAAVENYQRLDGALQQMIDAEIPKFLDAWNIDTVWAKRRGPIGQIKNDRTVMRAFGSHWDGGTVHVVLILASYKKQQEDQYWALLERWKQIARDWRDRLSERAVDGTLVEVLARLDARDEFRILGPSLL